VVRLTDRVSQLEARLKKAPQTPATPVRGERPDNPAYIQIQANLEAAQSERTSLRAQRSQVHERLNELERRGATAPAIERDYTALMSDLTNAQKKHAEVQQKQMERNLPRISRPSAKANASS